MAKSKTTEAAADKAIAKDTTSAPTKHKKSESRETKQHKRKPEAAEPSSPSSAPSKRLKPTPSTTTTEDGTTTADAAPLAKHPSIQKKFQSLLRTKSTLITPTPTPASPSPPPSPSLAPQGLHPLPQPSSSRGLKPHVSLASSLPPWLAAPLTVPQTHTTPFTTLPLPEKLQSRLKSHLNLTSAFAVQAALIPLLLLEPTPSAHDILVSAPTGSGKTLAYILPLTAALHTRTVTRLRALIVVPTRELITQVLETAESLASGLRIGISWGARTIDSERSLLVKDTWAADIGGARPDDNYDMLICTPGRLVEHLTTTPGFSLRDLEYLVVDEADRLLAQSFQEWLDVVVRALDDRTSSSTKQKDYTAALGLRPASTHPRKIILSATMTKDAGKLAGLNLRRPKLIVIETPEEEGEPSLLDEDAAIDEEAQAAAGAGEIDTDDDAPPDETFAVPSTLVEHYISVSAPEDKPLYLAKLLATQTQTQTQTQTSTTTTTSTPPPPRTLIFTKSNESAARLARLLELILLPTPTSTFTPKCALVTGELNKSSRKRTLAAFARNEVNILVCSDLISRGLDFPHISHVINYDTPSTLRSYVHRVGRTARAGNAGHAWSLVAENEARWFWRNVGRGVRRGGGGGVRREAKMVVDDDDDDEEEVEGGVSAVRRRYEDALERLGGEVKGAGREGRERGGK
ncbi:P-loop containing nucleoside triphosphate hydrolase protein [Peziza echinospora]|nr:P-loop containing nucleoside triphosphate hydrolase protein [Peziza echinospora]